MAVLYHATTVSDLLRAYKARELTNLDRAIAAAYAANEHGIFDQQIIHAKRLRDRLAAVRTMQEMVRNTDNRMIGELRQYNTPPVGVHQTVMASLLLLGYSSAEIQVISSLTMHLSDVILYCFTLIIIRHKK